MIDILYRACGKEIGSPSSVRPDWFSKLKCFRSFWNEFEGHPEFTIHVIYDGDGTEDELSKYIKSLRFEGTRDSFLNIYCRDNAKSWFAILNFARSFKGDFLYFAEDDYLYRPGAASVLSEGLQNFKLVTLYDHADRYLGNDDVTKWRENIFMGRNCHWRSCESTTLTFGISRELFEQNAEAIENFSLNDRPLFRYLVEKGIRLFSPMPGYATHLVTKPINLTSPLINWEKINAEIQL